LPPAIASDTSLRRLGLGLGQAFACLGLAEGGFLLALGFEDHRLLLALGLQDRGLAEALRLEHVGALLALGLHLPRHRIDQVARRLDVLELDAVDLDAPRMRRRVDRHQHLGVDLVALGQRLVQVHASRSRYGCWSSPG
jgi:hypothetical protein